MKLVSLKNKLHKTFCTIRMRILLITISIIFLISGIITAISYYLVSGSLRQNLLQTSEINLSFVCSSINTNIEGVTNYIHSCQTSDRIQKFAMESDTADNHIKREAHDFVTDTYASNSSLPSHLVRLVIIGKYRNDIIQLVEASKSTGKVSSQAILETPYFELLHDNPGKPCTEILPDPFYTARQIPMIPFLYMIYHPYKADEIGYIFAEISTNVLTDPLRNYPAVAGSQFYYKIGGTLYQYTDGTLIPCTGSYHIEPSKNIAYTALHDNTSILTLFHQETKETSLLIAQPLLTENWSVMLCVDQHQLSQNILRSFLLILFFIIVIASIIGVILFNFLSKTINVPVNQLQKRIRRIEQGDFSRDSSTEWEHELGDIGKTINRLSENVLHLMNQRIEDEKQKKDYEYQMLQSQINPHFMHNTLNSIKWMATIQNAPGIAEMTTSLARLLKNVSNGTASLITIEEELALIQDYFTIQQYRYGGTITLSIKVEDESFLSCQILRFTLQPLIENAIFHGIEPKGTAGTIQIHVLKDTCGDIHIDVSDDGVGISPELIDTLLKQHSGVGSASFFKEIGLDNVHKRLQYEFGSPYGLSIKSAPGQGTTVTILLPFRFKQTNAAKFCASAYYNQNGGSND